MSAELVAAAEDLLRMISTVEEWTSEQSIVLMIDPEVTAPEVQNAIDHLHYVVQAARRAEGRAAIRARS